MAAITEQLQRKGVPFETLTHGKAFTSLDEAHSLGIAPDEVLKTLIVDTAAGHALIVLPADRRVDMRLVEKAVDDKHAHLATEEGLARDFPGIELGALPPIGSVLGAATFVDPEVMQREMVVFAAGSTTESVRIRTEDLFRGEAITVTPLARATE